MLKLKIPYAHWPAVSKILSVLQKAEEEKKKCCPEEREANEPICLSVYGERQQKHSASVHCHMGGRLPQTHA